MWVTLDGWGRPNIVWADTRVLNGTVEEDVYFSRVDQHLHVAILDVASATLDLGSAR